MDSSPAEFRRSLDEWRRQGGGDGGLPCGCLMAVVMLLGIIVLCALVLGR